MQGLNDRRHEGFFILESTGQTHKKIGKQNIEFSQTAKTILTSELKKNYILCPGLKLN